MTSTVLIVEDNPHTVELVSLYLRQDGYSVLSAMDGIAGLELFREHNPDLVVLDLMLPRLDGLQVCRTVRAESEVPIIMLTARVEEEDRVAGLEMGADDYVTKPFSPRELAARIRAVLRRATADSAARGGAPLAHGAISVDTRTRTATLDGAVLKLTPTEFRLLTLLVRTPGKTFTRDEIIDRVFGYDFDGFDRTVDSHVSGLRRKLDRGGDRRYIQTVYGVGYRLDGG